MTDGALLQRRPGLARAALLIASLTVLARLVGFARVLVFARTVGPTCLGDTYYTANTIPNILFDVVAGGALSSLVVPLLADAADRADVDATSRTASALLTWTVTVLLGVAVVGAFLATALVGVLVGHPHPPCARADVVDVGARMLLVFLPQLPLYGVGVVLTGVLQSYRRFTGPALAPLLSSAVVIAAYLVYAVAAQHRRGTLAGVGLGEQLVLSVGTTLGVAALSLPLLLPVWRTGVRLRPVWRFPPGVAVRVRRLALSGAVVLGAQQLATAVVLRLANGGGHAGAVVLYNLAWTVFLLPWAVLAVPIATSVFPALSARAVAGDQDGYRATAAVSTRLVVVSSAAAACALLAVAQPAARVLVLGAPGRPDPVLLGRALVAFAPGLLGYSLVALLSRALYGRGDTRGPAVAVAAGWAVTVLLDVVLVASVSRAWTVAALGVGTTVGMTVSAVALTAALVRAAGVQALSGVPRAAVTVVAAAVPAVALGRLAAAGLARDTVAASLLSCAVVGTVTVVAFGGVAWLLDPDDVRRLLRRRTADA